MKKVILASAVAVLTVFSVNAQADSDLVQLGAKGGVNFATVSGDDFDSPDSRTSFHVGFVAEVPYSERFSLQGEVLYSGQGFKIDNEFVEAEYKLDYINIPLMAKFYLVEGLSVLAGPQIGFNINEKIEVDVLGEGVEVGEPTETEDIDFGVVGGLEYKLDNGFFVQGRYNYGITELVKDADVHNSVFQLGVGFMF